MNIDREIKQLQPKRFRFTLNPTIFVYHPLPHKENDELLREWKDEDERKRSKQLPLYRDRFLLYHKNLLKTKLEIAKTLPRSNISDMAEAKQWYWVMKKFPFDYVKAERRANELRLEPNERRLAREVNEWFWCAERQAFLRYLGDQYSEEDRKRAQKYHELNKETRFEMSRNRKNLIKSQTTLSTELRLFLESRHGLIFDFSQITTMQDPNPRDVREMILRMVQQFNKEIQKRFLQKLPKSELKCKMFELSLVQEATNSAFNSIMAYLREMNRLKSVVHIECTINDNKLYLQTQYIKEQFRAAIASVGRLDWVKFSEENIEDWQDRVSKIIERQLNMESLAAHTFVQLYTQIIADERPSLTATEADLLDHHKHNRYILLKLQKAPQVISMGLFIVHMEIVWKSIEVKLKNLQHSLMSKIRKSLTEHLKSLVEDFRKYDRTFLFRSINPALMLANKAKVNHMLETEVEESVTALLKVYDRIIDITQSVALEPSQNDLLITLAQLRLAQPQLMKEHQRFFQKRISTFTAFVNKKQTVVMANAQKVAEKLKILQTMGSPQEAMTYLDDLAELKPVVEQLIIEIDDLNQYEKVVGVTVSDVPKMRHAAEDIEIMEQLFRWTDDYLKNVEEFFESRRTVVCIERTRDFMQEYLSKLNEFELKLNRQRAARHFIVYARNDVDSFKKNIAIAEVMSCNRLLDRHWTKISEIVGFDMSVHANSTVSVICELGLEEYLAQLKPIAFAAEREALIADQLDNVISHWTTAHFELSATDYWLIEIPSNLKELTACAKRDKESLNGSKESDEVGTYINEMIIKWLSMVTSLEELLAKWSFLLDDWLRVAKIFQRAKTELEDSFQLFRRCGKFWRRFEQIIRADSSVIRVLEVKHASCWLATVENHMNMVVKAVRHYLNGIRLSEPRLVICSDYDLVTLFSAKHIGETINILLSEAFPQLRRLAINSRGVLELADKMGERIVLEDLTEKFLEQMGPCEIIKSIEEIFSNKVVELLTIDRSEYGRSIPKMVGHLLDALEFKNDQDNLIVSRMDKSFYIQQKSLGRQATLTLDFISLMEPKKLPADFSDNWANGQFLILTGPLSDTRYLLQNLTQRLFVSTRYINCHEMIEDGIFALLVQASLQESLLLVLENVNNLSPHAFFALVEAIGGIATQDHPFPRLIMTSSSAAFSLVLNTNITVIPVPSRLQAATMDSGNVPISPTAFQLASPATSSLTSASPIRKTVTPSKMPVDRLVEEIRSRTISACVGPMAKSLLKESLNQTTAKVNWIYVDALAITELLAPSTGFGFRAGGLLLDILGNGGEYCEEGSKQHSYCSSLASETVPLQRIVVFYGHNMFWSLFPFLSSLFKRFDGNLIPRSYISLFDGSSLRPKENIHCILCIPDDSGIRLEMVEKFGIPYRKYGADLKRPLLTIYKEEWRVKFEMLLCKASHVETVDEVIEEVVSPLCLLLPNLNISDLLLKILYQEISEAITIAKTESVTDVIRTSLVVVSANILALNTANNEIIDKKVFECLSALPTKSSIQIPPDVTSYRIGNGEYRLVKWNEEPCVASAMEKDLRMKDLMVVLPEFDRSLHYGLRMLSLGKNLIINGPPFTLKTTLVKMLERELSSSGASFYWMGSQWRVELESIQRKFARIIEETKNDQLKYIVIDKFSSAELLLPVIELFVDHQLYYSNGELKETNVQLTFILITEEDDWLRIEGGHFFWQSFSNLPMRPLNYEDSKLLVEKLIHWNFTIKSFSSEYQKLVDPLASAIVNITLKPYVTFSPLPMMIRLVKGLQFAFPDNTPDTESFIRLFVHETHRVILDAIDSRWKPQFMRDMREILTIEFNISEKTLLDGLQLQTEDHTDQARKTESDGQEMLFSEMDTNETMDGLCYIPVKNMQHFNRTIENFQFEHHRNHPRDRIHLAIDDVASFNIQRVYRVMRQAGEHLCLAGMPGNGRSQTVKLATAAHNALLINLFLEPSSFDSFITAWNSVLNRAILSIACNNQPVNILINMDYCYERLEPRWMEYIRLWLESPQTSSLLSDEQLLALGEQIIDAEKTLASQMQSIGIRIPGQRMCRFLPVEVLKEADQLRKFLEARIHDFLHCIFLIDGQYKTDFSWCTVVSFRGIDKTSWHRICAKQLSDCKLTLDFIPDLLIKLFKVSDEYLKKIESTTWKDRGVSDSNTFYAIVEVFQRLYQTEKMRLTKENRQLADALNRIQKIRDCAVVGESVDGNELAKRLETSETELSNIAVELYEKSERLDNLQKDVVSVEQEASALSEEIKQLSTTIESQLKEPSDEFMKTSTVIREFSSSDYKKYSLLPKPSLGCRYVTETLRVLFSTGFKPSRNTLETWLESQKFLRSPGLINKIATCDPDSLTLDQIQLLRKYVNNREFRAKKIGAECGLAGALCDWILSLVQIACLSSLLKEQQEELRHLRSKSLELDSQVIWSNNEIHQLEDRVQKLSISLRNGEQSIMNDRRLNDYRTRAGPILDVVKDYENEWKDNYRSNEDLESKLAGDCIILAAFQTLLIEESPEVKQKLLKFWLQTLSKYKVKYSPDKADPSMLMMIIIRNLPYSRRFALLIDETSTLMDSLVNIFPQSTTVDVQGIDWNSAEMSGTMIKHIYSGMPTIFTVNTCPTVEYYPVLSKWIDTEFQFRGKNIELPDDCLFIFVSKEKLQLTSLNRRIMDVILINQIIPISKCSPRNNESTFLQMLSEFSASDILESSDNYRKLMNVSK